MRASDRAVSWFGCAAAVALSAACGGFAEGPATAFTRLPASPDQRWLGAARFTYDAFGGINTSALETNAIPWKVATAALALERADQDGAPVTRATVSRVLREFGFIEPASIANWPSGPPPPPFEQPLGIVTGYAERSSPLVRFRIQIANLGCAACHAGVTYDPSGMPRMDVWLGLPNTSLDLEAYSWALYRALGRQIDEPPRVLDAVRTLYPETDTLELDTMRRLLIPRIARRLDELEATIGAPAPFSNGAPGMTNGVGALKRLFDLLAPDARADEVGFTSIPALGDVLFRSSLLADGTFAPRGDTRFRPLGPADVTDEHVRRLAAVVAFFTVPAMGNDPDRAERQIPKAVEVMTFLGSYGPPPFPGPIDGALAGEGRGVYATRCAECHGTYDENLASPKLVSFPNRLVPLADIGTDSTRATTSDSTVLRALMRTAYRRHVSVAGTGGYVAPRLSGIWATAPYLHNGSVPTLWHLMRPGERPARFTVGGHRLDFERMGIALVPGPDGTWRYPTGYVPWSNPYVYDTSRPGLDNGGHEPEFEGLTERQILALIEFLKLL